MNVFIYGGSLVSCSFFLLNFYISKHILTAFYAFLVLLQEHNVCYWLPPFCNLLRLSSFTFSGPFVSLISMYSIGAIPFTYPEY